MRKQVFCTLTLLFSLTAFCRERTPEEVRLLMDIPLWQPSATRADIALPKAIDNSLLPCFPRIFSQRGGSCSQASAVRYAFTYEYNRLCQTPADSASRIFSYHWTWNFLNEGKGDGSFPEYGYRLMKTIGALPVSLFNDESDAVSDNTWPSGFDLYRQALKVRVRDFHRFSLKTQEGIDLLRLYLTNHGQEGLTGGVVCFSCYTEDWELKTYKGPSTTRLEHIIVRNGTDGAHALTICGFDDEVAFDLNGDGILSPEEQGAFLIANSWGTSWATNGKCYYPYLLFLQDTAEGGLSENNAQALCVEPEEYTPSLLFRIRLSYSSRNDLSLTLGMADGEEATEPQITFAYPIVQYQGGDLPMRGERNNNPIEMTLDFSSQADFYRRCSHPKFFLQIRRTAIGSQVGKGVLEHFSVVDLERDTTYHCPQCPISLDRGLLTASTAPTRYISRSEHEWRYTNGEPKASPFILRDAEGQEHTIRFLKQGNEYFLSTEEP